MYDYLLYFIQLALVAILDTILVAIIYVFIADVFNLFSTNHTQNKMVCAIPNGTCRTQKPKVMYSKAIYDYWEKNYLTDDEDTYENENTVEGLKGDRCENIYNCVREEIELNDIMEQCNEQYLQENNIKSIIKQRKKSIRRRIFRRRIFSSSFSKKKNLKKEEFFEYLDNDKENYKEKTVLIDRMKISKVSITHTRSPTSSKKPKMCESKDQEISYNTNLQNIGNVSNVSLEGFPHQESQNYSLDSGLELSSPLTSSSAWSGQFSGTPSSSQPTYTPDNHNNYGNLDKQDSSLERPSIEDLLKIYHTPSKKSICNDGQSSSQIPSQHLAASVQQDQISYPTVTKPRSAILSDECKNILDNALDHQNSLQFKDIFQQKFEPINEYYKRDDLNEYQKNLLNVLDLLYKTRTSMAPSETEENLKRSCQYIGYLIGKYKNANVNQSIQNPLILNASQQYPSTSKKKGELSQQDKENIRLALHQHFTSIENNIDNNEINQMIMSYISYQDNQKFKELMEQFEMKQISEVYKSMERNIANYYCYIFIDGLKLSDLDNYTFFDFLSSIFYVGKAIYKQGCDRLYDHLKDIKKGVPQRIAEILNQNSCAYVMKVIDNVTQGNALIIEQSIYDVYTNRNIVNLPNLINKIPPIEVDLVYLHQSSRNFLGIYTLLNAFQNGSIKMAIRLTEVNMREYLHGGKKSNREPPIWNPFKCPNCETNFKTKDVLKNHVKVKCKNGNSYLNEKMSMHSVRQMEIKKFLFDQSKEFDNSFYDNISKPLHEIIQLGDQLNALENAKMLEKETLNFYRNSSILESEALDIDKQKLGTTYYYLLLDGRLLKDNNVNFDEFVKSIFYVKCLREYILPVELLHEAVNEMKNSKEINEVAQTTIPTKFDEIEKYFVKNRIKEIFSETDIIFNNKSNKNYILILKVGVHLSVDCATDQARAIIDTLGIRNLENVFLYGNIESTTKKDPSLVKENEKKALMKRQIIGAILLTKAFSLFHEKLHRYIRDDIEKMINNGISVNYNEESKRKTLKFSQERSLNESETNASTSSQDEIR